MGNCTIKTPPEHKHTTQKYELKGVGDNGHNADESSPTIEANRNNDTLLTQSTVCRTTLTTNSHNSAIISKIQNNESKASEIVTEISIKSKETKQTEITKVISPISKVDTLEISKDHQVEITALNKELNVAKISISELTKNTQNQNELIANKNQEIKQLNVELQRVEKESHDKHQLQNDIIEQKDKEISELKLSNNTLNMNNNKLTHANEQQQQMIDKQNEEIEQLKLLNTKYKKQSKMRKQKLNKKDKQQKEIITQKDTEIGQLNSLYNKLKMNAKELKKKNEKLQKIIDKQNKEINQLKISNKHGSSSNSLLTMTEKESNGKCKLTAQKVNGHKYLINNEEKKQTTNETKAGMIGLTNIGNTCWMNSIIQCVSHIPKVIEYFTNNQMNGNISKSLKIIINNIWDSNHELMQKSLHKFKSGMSNISNKYGLYEEQDPAEFLDNLINELHDELNIAFDEYANNDAIVSNGLPDNMVSILSWTAFLKSNNSPIVDLFYGQHKSSIMCANEECKYNYVIFEPFKILAVSTVCIKQEQYSKKGTLYDCIDKYVSENKLINTNWYCSKCKQDLPNSIEQIQLYKFPKVLIIQLKKK
eukprot:454605_1